MPVVIGTIGSACESLTMHFAAISDDETERIVQKNVLLGTAQILWDLIS